MAQRDMTQRQFDAAVNRHGFVEQGYMGYYQLPPPYSARRVSILNAPDNRRAQLAYLLAEADRASKESAQFVKAAGLSE